jgi:hypothetical protein
MSQQITKEMVEKAIRDEFTRARDQLPESLKEIANREWNNRRLTAGRLAPRGNKAKGLLRRMPAVKRRGATIYENWLARYYWRQITFHAGLNYNLGGVFMADMDLNISLEHLAGLDYDQFRPYRKLCSDVFNSIAMAIALELGYNPLRGGNRWAQALGVA